MTEAEQSAAATRERLIHIQALGEFKIRRGDAVLRMTDWPRRKAARLLQRLALERRMLKEQAIEFLWPQRDPKAGANNLYRTIYTLRKTLDRTLGEGTADAVFTFQAGVLRLRRSVWVDTEAFEQLIAQAMQTPPDERRSLLDQALSLYIGDLLPNERYAEWTFVWRTRLRRSHRKASLALADLYRDAGEYTRAVELLTPLLDDEPTDESVHRALMRTYALAGRRDAAIHQYETCVDALAAELSVPPGEQTTALYDKIRDGTLSPPTAVESDKVSTISPPIFGRKEELRLIAERLDNPQCRLLTLIGPGGIGKTRLALQAASDSRLAFEHGVVVAYLASSDDLLSAIADELQLTFPAGRSPKAYLLTYLRDKQLLLVLDNFDHLVEAGPLLTDILAYSPGVKILVTSREQLNVQQEWVIEVEALRCPEDATVANAEDYSAIRLFLYAARQLRPGFTLSAQNRQAIVRICHLTGGLPLALELAAGWVRALSVTTLADEIAQNPDVLTTTMEDVAPRHRSLRAVFEESWQQLTGAEQAVFSRLSVFRGSFSREAAEQVAGASLSILSALVAKSRLKRTSVGRYELHPLLRQFAEEKLGTGDEQERTWDRHCRYYSDFLATMATRLREGDDKEALALIETERDDVRAAWRRAVARQDIAAIDRSVESLALFYQIRGRYEEALHALDLALQMVDTIASELERMGTQAKRLKGKLLARQGSIDICLRMYKQADARLEESLVILRAVGAREEMAYVYKLLGDSATLQGMPAQAKDLYQKCMDIYMESDDRSGIGWAHNRLGWVSTQLGDYEEAERHLRRSLVAFRELDHRRGLVGALSDLGLLTHRRGAYKQAQRHYQKAIALSREIGYEDGTARSLCELSDVCRDLGHYRCARDCAHESLAIYQELGSFDQIRALYRVGRLAALQGDYATAESRLHESLALSWEAGSLDGVAHTIYSLGELALSRGNHGTAQHRFRESLARFGEIGRSGNLWGVAKSHYGLGRTAYALRAYRSGYQHMREALTIAHDLSWIPHILDNLVEMAAILESAGKRALARDLMAFTLDHPACRKITNEKAHERFAAMTASLGADVITAIHERALSQNLDRAVRDALSYTV